MTAAPTSLLQPFAGRAFRGPGRAYAHKDALALVDPGGMRLGVDETAMCATFVITSDDPDRVGDVVDPQGLDLTHFRKNPVGFYNHQGVNGHFMLPIGKWEDPGGNCTIRIEPHRAVGTLYFSQRSKEAAQVFDLVVESILRATSIGFNPTAEPRARSHVDDNPNSLQIGFYFPRVDLLEGSVVGIPAQPTATLVRQVISRGTLAGSPIAPMVRKSLESISEPAPAWANGWTPLTKDIRPDLAADIQKRLVASSKANAATWNRALDREFAVESMPSRPANVVYAWVSRHIGCEVKKLYRTGETIPSARMGSFLTGLKVALADYQLKDVRNLLGDGSETPPTYQTVQLNSKSSDSFLVSGIAFYAAPWGKFVLEFEPDWRGLSVIAYASQDRKEALADIFEKARSWARANNFLKGEAFALSGEFLPRTDEDWPDVILEKANKKSLKRTTDLLNEKGRDFPNRGIILTGDPGTGKTLSGRILRNQAKATFIWVSARDFHYAGSFGGLSYGFELAKELAPSVLFFEDVDNWLHETSIDYLKSEMDGIARSSGVLTVLTTNFPERLPAALIDRPGRFHDVLHFDLPTPEARRAMLRKWLPDLPAAQTEQAVERTEGYSGAHVYELAHFARSLGEHDGRGLAEALGEALQKVEEQRDLITQLQLTGSRFRLRKEVQEAVSKKWGKRPKFNKPRVDKGACVPCEASKTLIATISKEARSALQECVSHKIPKLIDEGYDHERAIAAAFHICGEKPKKKDEDMDTDDTPDEAPDATPEMSKHIRHEGDQWVLYSHEGEVLGRHDSREDAEAQEAAIEAHKHGKGLAESDGVAGGYTVPPGEEDKDDEKPWGEVEPGKPQATMSKAFPPEKKPKKKPDEREDEPEEEDEDGGDTSLGVDGGGMGKKPPAKKPPRPAASAPPAQPPAAPPGGSPAPKPPLSQTGAGKVGREALHDAVVAMADATATYLELFYESQAPEAPPAASGAAGMDGGLDDFDDDFDLDLDEEGSEGEQGVSPEETPEEEDEDEDMLEQRYHFRDGKPGRTKAMKKFNPATMKAACHAAAMHLKMLAQHKGEYTDLHRDASTLHHRNLMSVVRSFEGMSPGESPADGALPEEKPPDEGETPAPFTAKGLDVAAIQKALADLQAPAGDSPAQLWNRINGTMSK